MLFALQKYNYKMNPDKIILPSNYKFGIFFSFISFAFFIYFFYFSHHFWYYIFGLLSIIFLSVTVINAEILLPLNKLWFKVGILLGKVVSPLVMGIIFFGIFTPIAIFMRFSGRDELRIKMKKKTSHWILRNMIIKPDSFNNQF